MRRIGSDKPEKMFAGQCRRTDRLDPHDPVDRFPFGLVNPRNHTRNLENLTGDLSHHQIDVVLIGCGNDNIGPFDFCLFQDGDFRAVPLDPEAAELDRKSTRLNSSHRT